ncbi:hypothetical protein BDV25DRAFT_166887 [Aspergillus avenaceus]|uniref:Uncharacterized protein n=1 Tax=Aspergillus avenaceus TaxID=36643 RepID=A0A5N6TDF0_ASPAV|nr:hypothetical protein BDV25DRAFT_166887 [Aspergillus avenaceus]
MLVAGSTPVDDLHVYFLCCMPFSCIRYLAAFSFPFSLFLVISHISFVTCIHYRSGHFYHCAKNEKKRKTQKDYHGLLFPMSPR